MNHILHLPNRQEDNFTVGPARMTFQLVHHSLSGLHRDYAQKWRKSSNTVVNAVVHTACQDRKPENFKTNFLCILILSFCYVAESKSNCSKWQTYSSIRPSRGLLTASYTAWSFKCWFASCKKSYLTWLDLLYWKTKTPITALNANDWEI